VNLAIRELLNLSPEWAQYAAHQAGQEFHNNSRAIIGIALAVRIHPLTGEKNA
jgi:hypothetical protein